MSNAETLLNELTKRKSGETTSVWPIFWLLLLVAALPMMVPYLIEMWKLERYRYFPLVILSVGLLAYTRSDGTFHPPKGWLGWSAVGCSLLLITGSAALQYSWFGAVGFVLLATCCLASMRGPRDATLLGVALPLLLLLRLPFRSDTLFVVELQSLTTRLSSVMLDVLAVPHDVSGNVIKLAEQELFVAEACSGIQSVFTLAFLACLLVSYMRLRLWLFPFYLLMAVLLAVAANIMRVTTIAVASAWYQLDLSSGWMHELLGYACLAVAVAFLFSFDRLVVIVFHPVSTPEETSDINPLVRLWNWISLPQDETDDEFVSRAETMSARFGAARPGGSDRMLGRIVSATPVRWAFVSVIGVVSLFSILQIYRSQRRPTFVAGGEAMLFDTPDDLLQGEFGFLSIQDHQRSRGGANPKLGQNADLWECAGGDVEAQLVLSQAYNGWHELCVCYEGRSWKLVNRSVARPPENTNDEQADDSEAGDPSYAVARFKGDVGQTGYLFFSAIRGDGSIVEAPTQLGAFGTRFLCRLDYGGVWELDHVMMLQLWVVSPNKLPHTTIDQLERDFVTFRSTIAEAVREAGPQAAATTDLSVRAVFTADSEVQ